MEYSTNSADPTEHQQEPVTSAVIAALMAPKITFASHQNDVPTLLDLSVENKTPHDLENLTLVISSDPLIFGERTWSFDRIAAGSLLRPRNFQPLLAGGLLSRLTDRLRSDVRLVLKQGETLVAESRHQVEVLARNEWGGAKYMPELLAAFVAPNDPAVQPLLREASEILSGSGKSGSLEGYQKKSRTRVWEIMSGIWAAVSARRITYAVPPASFESTGQKIRLPSDVESTGLATCLDTAVLFASAFEQVGLHPVIVFTKGHAFAGAWLQPQYFPNLTVEDSMVVRKSIALKELVVFETTLATADHPIPFTKAIGEAERQLSEENEGQFVYALDVRQARRRGIQPLSLLVESSATKSSLGLKRTAAPLDQPPDLPPFEVDEEPVPGHQTPEQRISVWRNSLLDLTKRNRLLNAKPSATMLPIFCPDPGALEDKIAERTKMRIVSAPVRSDPAGQADAQLYKLRTGDDWSENFAREALERNEVVARTDEKSLERACVELFRKAKADLNEGGSNTLFLVLGVLNWSPSEVSQTKYSAPLIMLPVKLERSSARSRPTLVKHEDEAFFNMTLLQMLRHDFKINLAELAGELPKDASGVDVKGIWGIVRKKVRDVPGFEVVEDVMLGTFSFAKYLMWKDLTDRIDTLKKSPFVRHLIDSPHEPYQSGARFLSPFDLDEKIDPSALFAPLNADSSQIAAIYASGLKGDFVLEGPPGTGKSETIGNIIAHNLAKKNKVLFVSEKMEALNVVYRRLVDAGLGDFCLELHSTKANKGSMVRQLDNAWRHRTEQSANEWHETSKRLLAARNGLNGLVKALHKPGPGGISVRDAIGRTLRYGEIHRLTLDWSSDDFRRLAVTPEGLDTLFNTAKRLGQRFSQLSVEDLGSLTDVNQADWSFGWQASLVASARKLVVSGEDFLAARGELLKQLRMADAPATIEEACQIEDLVKNFRNCERLDLGFVLTAQGRETLLKLKQLALLLVDYHQTRLKLSAQYSLSKIKEQPISSWMAERTAAEAKSWPFRGVAIRKLRQTILAANGMTTALHIECERDLECLALIADLDTKMSELAAGLPQGTFWHGTTTDPLQIAKDIAAGESFRTAVLGLANHDRDIVVLRESLSHSLCAGRDMLEPGGYMALSGQRFLRCLKELAADLSDYRGRICWENNASESDDIPTAIDGAKAIIERESRLNNWCAWVEARQDARAKDLSTLVWALEEGNVAPDQIVEVFRTAYCKWIVPLLVDASIELKKFSSIEHSDLIDNFRQLDRKLASLTSAYIRASLSSDIPTRDELQRHPGFGILSRQIQRDVKGLTVRQLIGQMGSALTTLAPCLLMSPLSVAQFLPAELELFDLVVFDEASQITVPDAIGAIARGKRSIVVGDPKQMPPTRFFEKGAVVAGDGDDDDLEDLESILDEALAARVPLHRLTGHYRSRHESLIAFSNHAYYEGELITFPSSDTRDAAVSLHEVTGVYSKGKARTNPIEAQAVAAAVVKHLTDNRKNHLSLGVVTLNGEQQTLIENLLDEEKRRNPALEKYFADTEREPVFVKNLETVQGDQRDVIMLSVCYGPTEPGAATMSMNFGPLNRKGGERRLNVAITRATSEVVVFCSFDPSMIDLTRTQAFAVRDLKHYLEFAQRGPTVLGAVVKSVGADNEYDSDFEMAVAEGLRKCGWTVRSQIGVSKFRIDLGVVHPDHPGKFLAGIECDGATYHRSPTARDRDRVRHIILERLGWTLLRIWSTDWFIAPKDKLAVLNASLQKLLEIDRSEELKRQEAENVLRAAAKVQVVADSSCRDSDVDIDNDIQRMSVEGHTSDSPSKDEGDDAKNGQFTVPVAGEGDAARFYEGTYLPVIRQLARTIVAEEGPVTFKRISDLIARAHGFKRTGKQISSTVWAAVESLKNYETSVDGHIIFWPEAAERQGIVDFRGLHIAGRDRLWKEVPLPERLGLVKCIAAKNPNDLARAVAETINYERLTETFRGEIHQLMDMLQS